MASSIKFEVIGLYDLQISVSYVYKPLKFNIFFQIVIQAWKSVYLVEWYLKLHQGYQVYL